MENKNWDGFYPPHNCKDCGKKLNADGGHPAELYAGTYTGLCYGCENKPQRIEKTYSDGSVLFSYPPHCPSWRRDRKTFYAYTDCTNCNGTGRLYVSRSFALGGSYYNYCKTCLTRFCQTPKVEMRKGKES